MHAVLDALTFTKSRERTLKHGVVEERLLDVLADAETDGMLSEALASLQSLRRRNMKPPKTGDDVPANTNIDFHRKKR